MSVRTSLALLCLLFLSFYGKGQQYSYTHYDIQQGLAGSTVYCMLQDKQGFLWFGTETGVSRFDGVHFKNFTTFDNLPDNQVLKIFEDSRGRIWMAPFNKSICYYYKGQIYNQQNDSLLKKIQLSDHIITFSETKDGSVVLQQLMRIHVVKPDNSVLLFDKSEFNYVPEFVIAGKGPGGDLLVLDHNCLLRLENDKLLFKESLDFPFINFRYAAVGHGVLMWGNVVGGLRIRGKWGDKRVQLADSWAVNRFQVLDDTTIVVNSQRGAFLYHPGSGSSHIYLGNEAVSDVLRDNEGNLWFSTLGHGVFMLNSPYIFNHPLIDKNGSRLGAYTLIKYKNEWLAGSDMTNVFSFTRDSARLAYSFRDSLPERVVAFWISPDNTIWAGTDSRYLHISENMQLIERFNNFTIKDLYWNGKVMLTATGREAFSFDVDKKKVEEIFWKERSTAILQKGDSIYIGTLDGLFILGPDRKKIDVGARIKQLKYRIMDIHEAKDGTLWIATFSGIFAYRNGQIISTISEQQGLISDICRTMDIFNNELWVGTNKGLQQIDITDSEHPVAGYSLRSELSSEIINAVSVDGNTVVVGTPEGVSIFDKDKITFFSRCDLQIDNITVTNRIIDWNEKPLYLSPDDNNIRFDFAGISYRSAGDIRYRYRLLGLDSSWKQTRENYLSYPTLPGGRYEFQVQAINKFSIKSPVRSVIFTIEKRLWQKTWFQAIAAAAGILLMWILVSWRIRRVRQKAEERNVVMKKIAGLEQLALKSQMNPHFIFNSLNSIQQYVIDKDVLGANRFISGFSRLIRQTLDMSARPEISLAEEISYLSTYLELEKMRLEDKFTYQVKADESVRPEECYIPPMILQPFVENCVRHGIRYRHDNHGRILVLFKQANGFLECSIEDNGVGRKASGLYKSANPIEYQSKGISLTSDRIALLNRNAEQHISVNIYDLEEVETGGTGTRVVLKFPYQCN